MVTDVIPTKKGADKWAKYSKQKGYKVSVRKVKDGYAVTRTRGK